MPDTGGEDNNSRHRPRDDILLLALSFTALNSAMFQVSHALRSQARLTMKNETLELGWLAVPMLGSLNVVSHHEYSHWRMLDIRGNIFIQSSEGKLSLH